jgi:uncharacterized protein YbbC (DUF1343 family)
MLEITVTARDSVTPVSVGAHMVRVIYERHKPHWQWREAHFDRLAGTDALRKAVIDGTVADLLARWEAEAEEFAAKRTPALLYQ